MNNFHNGNFVNKYYQMQKLATIISGWNNVIQSAFVSRGVYSQQQNFSSAWDNSCQNLIPSSMK